jgi:uncharacterized protein (DUF58 family)
VTTAVEDPARHEATLRRLELLITRRLDGMLHGDYQGLLLGAGSEPGEAREYALGDDVRHMDWNLTARTTIPHVRDTVADRELETWVVVDRTPSMDFGTARCEKRELALATSAAFALLTNRSGNRSGAVIVRPDGIRIVPTAPGRDAALAILHRLSGDEVDRGAGESPSGFTLADGLERADRIARRRGLVVVVSDFIDASDWPQMLRRVGRRHQVVAAEIRDPREDELPAVGLLTLVDPETGRRIEVQTNRPKLRARFAEAAAARRAETGARIRSAGARHVVLRTDRDWMLDLMAAVDRWRRLR